MNIDWTAAGVIVAGIATLVAGVSAFVASLALRANLKSVREDGEWKQQIDADRVSFKEFMACTDETIQGIQSDLSELREVVFARFGPASGCVQKSQDEIDAPQWAERVATDLEGTVEA